MRKQIAIVTGASGGIGKEFTKLMCQEELKEVWVIARGVSKLEALKAELGEQIRVIPADLTSVSEMKRLEKLLQQEQPEIAYLINNAGMLKMASLEDMSVEDISAMVDLNSKSMALMCKICRPYLVRGSRIINVASASAFLPLPYLNVYGASKAFARNFSRALNAELKGTGITATALCPGWVDTPLVPTLYRGKPIKFWGVVTPGPVAAKALRDAKKGKDISVYSLPVKALHAATKIVPQRAAMAGWCFTIRKNLK